MLVREDNGLSNIPAIATLALADRDEALEHLDEAGADAHRRGALFGVLGAHCWRAFTLLRRGELLDAESEALAGYDDMVLWGQQTGTVMAYTATVWCHIRVARGELEAARTALLTAGEERVPEAHSSLLYEAAHAELLLAEGRPEEALAAAEAGGRGRRPRREPGLDPVANAQGARARPARPHRGGARGRARGAPGRTGLGRALDGRPRPFA